MANVIEMIQCLQLEMHSLRIGYNKMKYDHAQMLEELEIVKMENKTLRSENENLTVKNLLKRANLSSNSTRDGISTEVSGKSYSDAWISPNQSFSTPPPIHPAVTTVGDVKTSVSPGLNADPNLAEPSGQLSFEGGKDADKFLQDCESYFALNKIPQDQQVPTAVTFLKGNAGVWWKKFAGRNFALLMEVGKPSPWEEFSKLILEMYSSHLDRISLARELFSRQYISGSIETFILRTIELYHEWDPSVSVEDLVQLILFQLPIPMQEYLELSRVTTLVDLLVKAKRYVTRRSVVFHGEVVATFQDRYRDYSSTRYSPE